MGRVRLRVWRFGAGDYTLEAFGVITMTMPKSGLADQLAACVERGDLVADPVQMKAAEALDALLHRLDGFPPKKRFFSSRIAAPKGLYMWGGVGRGKSMLMDWFFERVETRRKRRVHFHGFMIDVHKRINAWRKLSKSERRKSENHVRGAGDDPIAPTAKAIARHARILCFDEFHVTDIADAMILSRLFEALWDRGVVVLATSNRAPEDLYKNGLNRALFEPFIGLMQEHMIIHAFDGKADHRLRQLQAAPIYYSPLGKDADAAMQAAWNRLTGKAAPRPRTLFVQGRALELPRTAASTVWVSFDRLCGSALGAADYIHIAKTFQTVILENVPQMGPDMRNEAKRFVTLIDALYETRTKLIISAETEPQNLYVDGTGAFEFERTVSRLIEMRSEDYLAAERLENAEDGI